MRLALVDVVALPESDLATFAARAEASMATVQGAIEELALARKALGAHRAQIERAHFLYVNSLSRGGEIESLERWKNLQDAERPLRLQTEKAMAALRAVCDIPPLPARHAIHPVATATTDADGRFRLGGLKSGQSYLITASASREVFGKTERYYWLERVTVKAPSTELQLNNRNLLSASDAPLVRLPSCADEKP